MGEQLVDMKLEVVILPVTDVDRAKAFYAGLGWRLDADISGGPSFRVVQMTPPQSQASIIFGTGITNGTMMLVVEDIQAARDALIAHGAGVSEIFHGPGAGFMPADSGARQPGPDPDGGSYVTFATFSDPDGNNWLLQEIKTRLPGREWE